MYDDKFRISYSFWECQLLILIAVIATSAQRTWNNDITGFDGL
jgi:hypothetical protein